MSVSWSELSSPMKEELQSNIMKNFDAMVDQNVANTLTGLAGMQVKYDQLLEDFQRELMNTLQRTISKMSDQQLSNTIHS